MLLHNNSDRLLSRRLFNHVWSKGLIFSLLLTLMAGAWPTSLGLPSVRAASPTSISICDEAHFLAALNIGGDITFSCSGIITLTTTPITGTMIKLNTSLDATGQNVTLDGGGVRGIFALNGSGLILTLNHLTLSHANITGALNNQGVNTMNVVNSTFSGNTTDGTSPASGAIFNFGGSLNITNSLFISNTNTGGADGGAIVTGFGSTNIADSTFIGNSNPSTFQGVEGGAVFNEGDMVVRNSTFSGNHAGSGNGFGGAIANESNLTVINSTFYNNDAQMGSAIFIPGPNTTILNSTIVSNTGSTAVEFEFGNNTVTNNIIANNPAGNCHASAGNINGHNNLETGATGKCGTGSILADPMVGGLADNGGHTQTMALLTSSPAKDAADNTVCQAAIPNGAGGFDQRGIARPQGNGCDIGAFETMPAQTLPAPAFLKASTFSPSRIDLRWQDNSTTETGFSVERRTSATTFSSVSTLPADTTTFSDTTVSADKLYIYRVQALQSGTSSAYSNEITVTSGALNLVVTEPTDNGSGTVSGSFSAVLVAANTGQVITFNVNGLNVGASSITVSGQLPSPSVGVTIDGGSCDQGPRITLDGATAPASTTGLFLNKGGVLKNLKITGFKNKQLVVLGGNGSVQTSCVVVSAGH